MINKVNKELAAGAGTEDWQNNGAEGETEARGPEQSRGVKRESQEARTQWQKSRVKL